MSYSPPIVPEFNREHHHANAAMNGGDNRRNFIERREVEYAERILQGRLARRHTGCDKDCEQDERYSFHLNKQRWARVSGNQSVVVSGPEREVIRPQVVVAEGTVLHRRHMAVEK